MMLAAVYQGYRVPLTGTYLLLPTMLVVAGVAGFSLIACPLLFSLQRAVPPAHRRMDPMLSWLLVIPLFNIIWNFFAFLRIPESYHSILSSHGHAGAKVERSLGLAYAICAALSVIPFVGFFAAVAAAALLLTFFIRMYQLKSLLGRPASTGFPIQRISPHA
jgi:hypothetical protein